MSAHKVVLITAGSAGLGAQIARAFAPDFRVVINYANNAARADSLLKELSSIPSTTPNALPSPRFHAVKADVGVKSSVQSLVSETLSTMGRLDVVISNAGWTRLTNFMDFADGTVEEDWDKCFVYNVKTHLWLMEAARDSLTQNEGSFISTSSVAGVKPGGSSLPYSVTKAAQIHLAKGLSVICSPKVRVNSVSPGLMLTEWGLKFPEKKREAATNNTKLKRLPTVEDVADQVRTLALSKSMTGQNVVIDCGTTV
ncbi:NAD(P)-binding protein [Rhizodiscina lignyota]|uniref:NAD(P)-binding protein n=1 Tax=Rhizodiscina lignyota TaxID=1504668 RepID=A0A9P4IPQ3_9PEZI|nr:NAD(P)-binding protein [Rhizodiscina lignyota]